MEYKKEIELLQENISVTSVQLLMNQKANQYIPAAESVYCLANDSDKIFCEGEQLEICDKSNRFWWTGKSLVSGDKGEIPSSCVCSMLESLQLLEYILSVEEVSLPILKKIRNDSFSNDEKASLFLEAINDDPIMISALRQDIELHDDKGNVMKY